MQRLTRRGIHTVPRLPVDPAKGIPGLFSAKGFQTAWTDYQGHVLKKLNASVVDTDNETRVPFHILLNTKDRAEHAHVFNYASQAHNNHLFFSTLKSSTSEASAPTGALLSRIETHFGDVAGLKRAVDRAAAQVLSNGWVFLIESPSKELAVVATNVAGSPYTFSRAQQVDLSGPVSEDASQELAEVQRAVSEGRKNWNIALLALNLWQHAYVTDFGVSGRQQYIDAWWSAVDWRKVGDKLFRSRT